MEVEPSPEFHCSDQLTSRKIRRLLHDKGWDSEKEGDDKMPLQNPDLPLLNLLAFLCQALGLDNTGIVLGRDLRQALKDSPDIDDTGTVNDSCSMRICRKRRIRHERKSAQVGIEFLWASRAENPSHVYRHWALVLICGRGDEKLGCCDLGTVSDILNGRNQARNGTSIIMYHCPTVSKKVNADVFHPCHGR